jgi:hypothetical protein
VARRIRSHRRCGCGVVRLGGRVADGADCGVRIVDLPGLARRRGLRRVHAGGRARGRAWHTTSRVAARRLARARHIDRTPGVAPHQIGDAGWNFHGRSRRAHADVQRSTLVAHDRHRRTFCDLCGRIHDIFVADLRHTEPRVIGRRSQFVAGRADSGGTAVADRRSGIRIAPERADPPLLVCRPCAAVRQEETARCRPAPDHGAVPADAERVEHLVGGRVSAGAVSRPDDLSARRRGGGSVVAADCARAIGERGVARRQRDDCGGVRVGRRRRARLQRCRRPGAMAAMGEPARRSDARRAELLSRRVADAELANDRRSRVADDDLVDHRNRGVDALHGSRRAPQLDAFSESTGSVGLRGHRPRHFGDRVVVGGRRPPSDTDTLAAGGVERQPRPSSSGCAAVLSVDIRPFARSRVTARHCDAARRADAAGHAAAVG